MKSRKKISAGDILGWFGYKVNYLKNNHVTSLGYPNNLDRGEQLHEVIQSMNDHLFTLPHETLALIGELSVQAIPPTQHGRVPK